jgi:hypothetical protein
MDNRADSFKYRRSGTLLELGCIIIPEGVEVEEDTLRKAEVEGVPMYQSGLRAYGIAKNYTGWELIIWNLRWIFTYTLHYHRRYEDNDTMQHSKYGLVEGLEIIGGYRSQFLRQIFLRLWKQQRRTIDGNSGNGGSDKEEVHILCLFKRMKWTMKFAEIVYNSLRI